MSESDAAHNDGARWGERDGAALLWSCVTVLFMIVDFAFAIVASSIIPYSHFVDAAASC